MAGMTDVMVRREPPDGEARPEQSSSVPPWHRGGNAANPPAAGPML